MTHFEANCAALRRIAPAIADTIESTPIDEFDVELARTGLPTARYRGVYIHSRHDPVREAHRILDVQPQEATFVVLGFGLGYHVEAARAKRPDSNVIIVEPSVARFAAALAAKDLRHIIADSRCVLLLDPSPESIPAAIRAHESGEIACIAVRGVRLPEEEELWVGIESALDAYQQRREINRNTLVRFGRLWIRNFARNLGIFAESRSVSDLQHVLSGLPALVLGAGPSLDRVVPWLRRLHERMVIIAVDTALAPCLEAGIQPDLAVVVDPQYWNTRHLDRVRTQPTILVSESSANSRIFHHLSNLATYFCGSLFPLGEYIEEATGQRGKLGAGGSVSTTAWDLARSLGCGPIVMAGVDLGFPGGRTHCSGSFFEEMTHIVGNRLKPAETHGFAYLYSADPYLVAANDDSDVRTDRRMVIYQWWFENQVRMHSVHDTKSLSPAGVRIEGVPLISIEALMSLQVRRDEVEASLHPFARQRPHSERRSYIDRQRRAIQESLDRLDATLAGLELTAREALALIDSSSAMPTHDLTAKLDEIDQRIYAFEYRRIPSFLMQDVISEVSQGSPGDPIEVSRRVYAALHESVRYHRYYLTRGRQRL